MATHAWTNKESTAPRPLCGQQGKDLTLADDARRVDCRRCLRLLGHSQTAPQEPTQPDLTVDSETELTPIGFRYASKRFRVRVTRRLTCTGDDGVRRTRYLVVFNGSAKAYGHGSGAAPTLSVSLNGTTGWEIHT